jgi:hypothetical protein
MVFEPFLGLFAGMFGVIILLIYDVLRRFAVMGKAFLKFIIQNLDEKVPIHPACIPRSIPKHAAPQHHRSTSKLHCCYIPVTLHHTLDLQTSETLEPAIRTFSFLHIGYNSPIVFQLCIFSCIPFLILLSTPPETPNPVSCYATHPSYCSSPLRLHSFPSYL